MDDTGSHITRTISKQLFTTNNPFEQKFGYHRAVRRGTFIFVSGTTAVKFSHEVTSDVGDSNVHFPGNAQLQAELAMRRCVEAIEKLGGNLEDVVRVKMFVARHDDCGGVGTAYRIVFSTSEGSNETDIIGAAATMIVVPGGFVDKDMLVEVEVDAVVG